MIGYVIGDNDMLTGFRSVGVDGVEVSSLEETEKALNDALKRTDIAIIIVSDVFSNELSIRKKIDQVRLECTTPLIVEIPSSKKPSNRVQLSDIIGKILSSQQGE
ncbi:MAG: V-type ATP synthase subunit F [Candidatus Bathyarchaeota archaeon]|nr:V-type ATP synthase subunit F [Candidatus Termiticorpusculum sp.]MCL2868408.1 V-type ATP synthase subunit F [Candidatus Termiticorpusculum sp.]